ncbi:hypothetical protein CVD28_02400 [Bacillus sp. M6-12]|uniref:hypothetical protein n=1 Tax=Bacillus sp. M6-12 TaxID=2054166 RepID=UPI000C76188E|nr:hypothetical protein [Bacillus sp. M6-12]PLS19283.1 hypothetical protein CVD28_02400 [Bacillus sp. M6-12]
MQTKEIILNGVTLSIEYDTEKMKEIVDSLKGDFEGQYTKMYSVDEVVTKEEFEQDIEEAEAFIQQLESDQIDLVEHMDKVRKKKNHKLWSKSGQDVLTLSNISEYFTDFTNAWRVMVFRLEVINETTCELCLRGRTYTY